MKKRNERQDIIRNIIREKSIRTQRDLVVALKEQGYDCTQATVSRDIADMGLCKVPEGSYVLAEDLYLQRMISDLVVSIIAAENLVVIRTGTGTANGVACSLDDAELPGVLGTVAGDDTILVVTADSENAKEVVATLEGLRTKR